MKTDAGVLLFTSAWIKSQAYLIVLNGAASVVPLVVTSNPLVVDT